MVSNMTVAPHLLRLYTWEALQNNIPQSFDGLVNGLIPIVPIEDEPALSDSGKPYIVYGFSESFGAGLPQIRRGIFSMRVRSVDSDEVTHIINVLSRLFEEGDKSAENVNLWTDNNNFDGELLGLRFTTLDTSYIESGDAAESEGGPVESVINISYNYVSQHKVLKYTPDGTWV